jgi:hypothetical protein
MNLKRLHQGPFLPPYAGYVNYVTFAGNYVTLPFLLTHTFIHKN